VWLKQNTAITFRMGPFVDSTDGFTPETLLTITQPDVRVSKAGAAFAQKSDTGGATHDENGWYSIPLNATDTNTLGLFSVAIYEVGALPVWRDFMVVPANVYDSLVGGSDALQVHTNEITNDLITAAAIANGAIDAATFAAGAIDAAAIATDAIGAAELAADAIAEIADAMWDEARSGHVAAGSFGEGVASVQGNVTGSVASVSGGVGGSVSGSVVGSVGSVDTGGITAASIATGAFDADALADDAAAEIADKVLGRNIAGGSDTGRTVKQALRILRNRRAIAAGTLTVYQEDDSTPDWTAAVTTAAGNPVNSVDPA